MATLVTLPMFTQLILKRKVQLENKIMWIQTDICSFEVDYRYLEANPKCESLRRFSFLCMNNSQKKSVVENQDFASEQCTSMILCIPEYAVLCCGHAQHAYVDD